MTMMINLYKAHYAAWLCCVFRCVWNRWVFRADLKQSELSEGSRRWLVKFQVLGRAMGKDRRPNLLQHCRGAFNCWRVETLTTGEWRHLAVILHRGLRNPIKPVDVITHSHGSARVLQGRRSKSMEKGKLWPPATHKPLNRSSPKFA